MTESDIEVILERAKELHPEARPRIISDNGPLFIAKDLKESTRTKEPIGVGYVRNCRHSAPTGASSSALTQVPEVRQLARDNPFSVPYAHRRYSVLIEPAIYLKCVAA